MTRNHSPEVELFTAAPIGKLPAYLRASSGIHGVTISIAGLSPAAGRQHERGVDFRNVLVEDEVAFCGATNDQFPKILANGAPHQGATGQNLNGVNQPRDSFIDARSFVLRDVIDDTVEIAGNLGCDLDPCHDLSPTRFGLWIVQWFRRRPGA
jgi:hypothetical protein